MHTTTQSRNEPPMPLIRPRAATLALLLLGACDSTTSPRTMESVAGDYRASTLALIRGTETTDFLARGARIDLALKPDGTTTGEFFVPGGEEDGGDLRENLAGGWTLRSDTVRLTHPADTFLRDVPFVVRGGELRGEYSASGARLAAVLRR